MAFTFARLWSSLRVQGVVSAAGLGLCVILPLVVQAAFLAARPRVREPWWRVAVGYAALMLVLDRVLWDPATGAITRVMLPLTAGFNVLLLQERPRSFWPWFAAGNLHLIPGLWVL